MLMYKIVVNSRLNSINSKKHIEGVIIRLNAPRYKLGNVVTKTHGYYS